MRILHLSDTHLFGEDGARHYERIDTAAALTAVIDRLRDLAGIDLVLHTGDASEDTTPASYRRLHDLLDPLAAQLGAPLAITMGNHDDSAVYAELAGPGDHGGRWQDRTIDLAGGMRLIILDTSVPGAGYGALDPEQLDWLAGVLSEPAAGGTIIAMHHPPLTGATELLRALDLTQQEAFARLLVGSDVRLVLSGHYHHEMSGSVAGVPVHVAPGITNVMDPLAAGGHEQAAALSGASIVELEAGRAGEAPTVTTAVWANAGDALADPSVPVYDLSPEEVRAIAAAAGPQGA